MDRYLLGQNGSLSNSSSRYQAMNLNDASGSTVVMGVGGAGIRMLEQLAATQPAVASTRMIAVNSDEAAMSLVRLPHLLIGASGLPAVCSVKGRDAALHSAVDIAEALQGARRLLVLAGLGGGVGTGAAPEIARMAMEMDIDVIVGVGMPGKWEGSQRHEQASAGLSALQSLGCKLEVAHFDELSEELPPSTTLDEYSAELTRLLLEKTLA